MSNKVSNGNSMSLIENAKQGDIDAFHQLFSEFQSQLKSYLFRLSTDAHLAEDICQDAFIQAYEKLNTFKGHASLKSWVFTIATNLFKNRFSREQIWQHNTADEVRKLAHSEDKYMESLNKAHNLSAGGVFEITEHIDYCFTCVGNMLPEEQQLVILLKEVYAFTADEIAKITAINLGKIKHLLRDGRKTMTEIFDQQCAMVNKQGACYQCSGLNNRFNPKADTQAELIKINFYNNNSRDSADELLTQRIDLVKQIDPLQAKGTELHHAFLHLAKQINQ